MKLGTTLSVILWLIIVLLSLLWNIRQSNLQYSGQALISARSFYEQIVLTREWGSQHGGVYVPVTENTRPNPYLDTPLRDLQVSNELLLTKVNPSFMLRQLSELSEKHEGMKFRITSLTPIRPANKPNSWEKKALKKFTKGARELSKFAFENNTPTFHYMAPLVATSTCLNCHKQAKIGDILGGISMQLPFSSNETNFFIYIGHVLMAIAGMAGVIIFWLLLGKEYRKIHHQTVVDALTGIANRRSFSIKIEEEYNRSQRNEVPLSVLMCDIDHFKQYNDNYGHAAGDTCLIQIAQCIKESIMRPGDFCARYGGEEFIVILPETTQKGAVKVAETILTNIRQLNLPHQQSPDKIVTLSIGIATYFNNSPKSYAALVKQADTFLYLAKQNGRNRVERHKNERS